VNDTNEWVFRAFLRFGLDNISALTDLATGNVSKYLSANGKVLTSANQDGQTVTYQLPGDRLTNPTTDLMAYAEKALWFLTSHTSQEVAAYLKSRPATTTRATFHHLLQTS
jgi:hypothetical protein